MRRPCPRQPETAEDRFEVEQLLTAEAQAGHSLDRALARMLAPTEEGPVCSSEGIEEFGIGVAEEWTSRLSAHVGGIALRDQQRRGKVDFGPGHTGPAVGSRSPGDADEIPGLDLAELEPTVLDEERVVGRCLNGVPRRSRQTEHRLATHRPDVVNSLEPRRR